MAKAGRPKLEINRELFEGLCRILCTKDEICGIFKISEDTLSRWLKRTYGDREFADVHARYAAQGRMSLRRAMFKNAESGNAQIQVFLAKNYLGLRDSVDNYNYDMTQATDEQLDRISAGEDPRAVMTSQPKTEAIEPMTDSVN